MATDNEISMLVTEGKKLIHKRQKLIKITDKNNNGWQVVEEYESDELASTLTMKRRSKKRKKRVAEKRKAKHENKRYEEKRQKTAQVGDSQFFRGKSISVPLNHFGVALPSDRKRV